MIATHNPFYLTLSYFYKKIIMFGAVMCESESGFGFESGFRAFWAGFGFGFGFRAGK